jgi:pilus assembly protein Flp/PilA
MPNKFFSLESQSGIVVNAYAMIVAFASRFFSVRSQKGVTMIEYALIAALVAVAVIVTLGLLGDQLNVIFQSVVDALTPAG